MEILRLPPYPLTTTWTLPDANYSYILYVEDLVDHSITEQSITSNSQGVATYVVPLSKVQYDRQFLVRFYDAEHEHIIHEENLDFIRPYINPNSLGTTAPEKEEYEMLELLARSIINTYIEGDFYNHKRVFMGVGQGADYYSIWDDPNRVLQVYENNRLIFDNEDTALNITSVYDNSYDSEKNLGLRVAGQSYSIGDMVYIKSTPLSLDGTYFVTDVMSTNTVQDGFRINTKVNWSALSLNGVLGTAKRVWGYEFKITLDHTSIYRVQSGLYNRAEAAWLNLPLAGSDLPLGIGHDIAFPQGSDYTFILDVGYKAVPPDIEYATKLLIDDLKCGKLDYYKRYTASYSTDQFKLQFDKSMFSGTGNMIVDKILDKYIINVRTPGIL